jgi:hypothetical protein
MSLRAGAIALAAVSIAKRGMATAGQLARRTRIAVIKWLRKLLTAGEGFGRLLGWGILVGILSNRVRLLVASVLFIAWMAYLGYAALTKSHSPIVSHIQVAAAPLAVVADVGTNAEGAPSPEAKVVESLTPGGPPPGTVLRIPNLPAARGFVGTGQYLLLLDSQFYIVGQLRSPGNDVAGYGIPDIYRWSDDVRKQYEKLHR